ncbi:hypothetical protein BN110_013 [Yersinia phage phiR8-01]|uniref:Uncharacterized protein n=1 Tax=Yersinia phage phiR8-01 TaxID=1206556 RepID=I7LGW7_9CAUD|nr:hypothetical protein HOT05_gp01 [Yersinia phage phiR8-01]CCI88394.1 hypothetical protein BN110_013 [Yersinia phage phiR8-01]
MPYTSYLSDSVAHLVTRSMLGGVCCRFSEAIKPQDKT